MNTQEHILREKTEALRLRLKMHQITRNEFLKQWKEILQKQADCLRRKNTTTN